MNNRLNATAKDVKIKKIIHNFSGYERGLNFYGKYKTRFNENYTNQISKDEQGTKVNC